MSKRDWSILEKELSTALAPLYYSALKTMGKYDFGVTDTTGCAKNVNI